MAGGLSGRAASVDVTGLVLQLNGAGPGVMASVHGEVTARAERRQRARSAPCGSRRERQRVRGSGRPRGELRWFGRRWVASSAPCLPLASAKPPPASVTGRCTFCCSSPTPASLQEIVRRRDKEEGTGSKAPPRHWRDRHRVLKKTTVALKCSLNFTQPDFDNALQVFDRMIGQGEKNFWSWYLVR